MRVNIPLINSEAIMSDFGKVYSRVPKRVFAKQWTPYSILPFVENVFIDMPQQQPQKPFDPSDVLASNENVQNYFAAAPKIVKVCVSGSVMLAGEKYIVEPLNWVLYSEVSQVPIDVITNEVFMASYTDKFELCPLCLAKSQAIRMTGKLPTFDDLVKSLEKGNMITLEDGSVIRSFADLSAWAERSGVKLG